MSRIAKSFGWTIIAIIALAATVALLRVPLAETGIRWWFAHEGLARPQFDVTRLDLDGLEIVDIAAGTDDALRIARVAVDWSAASLMSGRAENVTISGLQVRATINATGFAIPGIDLPTGTNGGAIVLPVLPSNGISVTDARLEATSPFGPLVSTASATYSNLDGTTTLHATLQTEGTPGRARLAVSAQSPGPGMIDGSVALADGAINIPAVKIPTFGGSGNFTIADGRLASVSGSLNAPTVETPTVPQIAAGRLDIEGVRTNGTGSLRLSFTGNSATPELSASIALSDIALAGDTVSANARITASAPDLAIAGIALRDAAVNLPLALRWQGDTATATLTEAGRLTLAGLSGGGIAVRDAVVATLPATETPLATIETGADRAATTISYLTAGAIAANAVTLPVDGAPRRLAFDEIRFHSRGRLVSPDGYSGRTTLASSTGTLDRPALRFTRIEADIKPADLTGNGTALFEIGEVADHAAAPLFGPVGVSLDVTRAAGATRFTAAVRDATQTIRATASGPWPLDSPRDMIRIDIPKLAFATGGMQPSSLLPPLSAVAVSQGSVAGNGLIRRNGDGFRISGDAHIADMSFAVAGADVAGLDATVQFDSLLPPTTPAGQHVTIRRIDLATPVEDVRIDYRLTEAGGTPRLDIASATARLLGGSLRLRDVAATLDGGPVDLPLAVEKLDVTTMLALLGIEGVDGSGTLSGTLPLRLSPTEAEIRDGHLAADGPGVLRLDSGTAADYLAAQGESVDLAVRALEDFHYSELTIGIARETGGEARLALSMLGANPAVLDGHPFRFNINLKSNVDELIDALLKGYSIAIGKIGDAR